MQKSARAFAEITRSSWHFQSLEKRRRELAKALDDNERMIEANVTRGRSDKELKLEVDIDKLARVRVNE